MYTRVGNLDKPNHDSIMRTIKQFTKSETLEKFSLLEILILRVFRGLGLKIWVTETAQISFLLTPLMGLGLINVFQDLPPIKVELLT